jgi:hypothetical protein
VSHRHQLHKKFLSDCKKPDITRNSFSFPFHSSISHQRAILLKSHNELSQRHFGSPSSCLQGLDSGAQKNPKDLKTIRVLNEGEGWKANKIRLNAREGFAETGCSGSCRQLTPLLSSPVGGRRCHSPRTTLPLYRASMVHEAWVDRADLGSPCLGVCLGERD